MSEIFSSTHNLFNLILESAALKSKIDISNGSEVKDKNKRQLSSFRSDLNSFMLCAKKVTTPTILVSVDGFDSLETADIFRHFPIMEGWTMILPSIFSACGVLHSLWHPNIRAQICQGSDPTSKLLFLPNLVDVASLVGVKIGLNQQIPFPIMKCCNELKELRLWLYLTLAQSCVHKAMYINSFTAQVSAFMSQLVDDCKVAFS